MISVRPLCSADKAAWLELWRGYLNFYETTLSDEITASVWERLLDDNAPIYGHVAEYDGEVVGLCNSVIHDATWTNEPVCYLEDLYVSEAARGQGAGRALIQNLLGLAKKNHWNRVYWHTHHDNKGARALYDQFVEEGGFVRYAVYTDKS
ncbi:MAG: GNAT family N-acetyltransferase [Alphaproteobacteria bacterium]|nr:GNAT family N-acetyltransferase [Alphaproteobacteria bacterium]